MRQTTARWSRQAVEMSLAAKHGAIAVTLSKSNTVFIGNLVIELFVPSSSRHARPPHTRRAQAPPGPRQSPVRWAGRARWKAAVLRRNRRYLFPTPPPIDPESFAGSQGAARSVWRTRDTGRQVEPIQ